MSQATKEIGYGQVGIVDDGLAELKIAKSGLKQKYYILCALSTPFGNISVVLYFT